MLIKTQQTIPHIDKIVRSLRKAAQSGTWDGRDLTRYFQRCRLAVPDLGMQMIFTRDTGYHTSGWWKNPDYERCYHLSLSFVDPETEYPAPRNRILTMLLLDALFGKNKRWLWCEPPYSDHGKTNHVWHYRLFCDAGWQPLKPRGEVYNREFTEAGWKSFSDVQADLEPER